MDSMLHTYNVYATGIGYAGAIPAQSTATGATQLNRSNKRCGVSLMTNTCIVSRQVLNIQSQAHVAAQHRVLGMHAYTVHQSLVEVQAHSLLLAND
jgi:hypothetical protein